MNRKKSPKKQKINLGQKLRKYKQKNQEIDKEIQQYQLKIDILKKKKKKNVNNIDDFSDYDIVVKIDSLTRGFKQGWEIILKSKEKNVRKFISSRGKNGQRIIGFLGNENVGKTFMANKITEDKFPTGFYVKTEGLSIKYSNNTKSVITCLDSAGSQSAINFLDEKLACLYFPDLLKKGLTPSQIELLKEKMFNDRVLTEHFIQNFILESCDIIIAIVGQLSNPDQIMIENLKRNYKKKKEIIIIHNLFKLTDMNSFINRIEKDIEEAFYVEKIPLYNTGFHYYIEKMDKERSNIVHLILGCEDAPSGIYNNDVLEYLKGKIHQNSNISTFDLEKKLNSFWAENFINYIKIDSKNENPGEIKMIDDVENTKTLFKIQIDDQIELANPSFTVNGFKETEIPYQCSKSLDENELIYYFLIAGLEETPKINQIGNKAFEISFEKLKYFKKTVCETNITFGKISKTFPLYPNEEDYYKFDEEKMRFKRGILKVVFSKVSY